MSSTIETEMENLYRESRLDVAAAIATSGGQLIGLERKSHRTLVFLLGPRDLCQRLSQSFEAGTLTVNAKAFTDTLRRFKDLLFSRLREENRDEHQLGTGH